MRQKEVYMLEVAEWIFDEKFTEEDIDNKIDICVDTCFDTETEKKLIEDMYDEFGEGRHHQVYVYTKDGKLCYTEDEEHEDLNDDTYECTLCYFVVEVNDSSKYWHSDFVNDDTEHQYILELSYVH